MGRANGPSRRGGLHRAEQGHDPRARDHLRRSHATDHEGHRARRRGGGRRGGRRRAGRRRRTAGSRRGAAGKSDDSENKRASHSHAVVYAGRGRMFRARGRIVGRKIAGTGWTPSVQRLADGVLGDGHNPRRCRRTTQRYEVRSGQFRACAITLGGAGSVAAR